MPRFSSVPFRFSPVTLERQNQRFDLILRGVRHIGCSYEGHVFFGNPEADEATERNPSNGYAASFYVFGHGDCYGAPGHCEPARARQAYDMTPPPASLPLEVHVNITEGIIRAAESTEADELTLTIVPVANRTAPTLDVDENRLMEITGRVSIVAYA